MVKKILIGLGAVIVILLGAVALQSSEMHVERAASINAPAAVVFAQINNLHNFVDWSPWAKLDPQQQTRYAGPDAGRDAALTWDGNNQVGKGTMTITESHPDEHVQFRLDFERPLPGTSMTDFTLAKEGDATRVTWTMTGHKNFIAKAIGLLMNCDKMVGDQFEQGLANLKALAEAKIAG